DHHVGGAGGPGRRDDGQFGGVDDGERGGDPADGDRLGGGGSAAADGHRGAARGRAGGGGDRRDGGHVHVGVGEPVVAAAGGRDGDADRSGGGARGHD